MSIPADRLGPEYGLPIPPNYDNVEGYIENLLKFVTTSDLLYTLCSRVHILEFFTRQPDIYSRIIDEEWQAWFDLHDLDDILFFILHENVDQFREPVSADTWRGHPSPPETLVDYVHSVRSLLLTRTPSLSNQTKPVKLTHLAALGMKVKKVHEVEHFSRYVDDLTRLLAKRKGHHVSHLVDFGAGQNYLGRALASSPYNKNVIAVEGRPHNVEGARRMDANAQLAQKPVVIRNKKDFKVQYFADKARKQQERRNLTPLQAPDTHDSKSQDASRSSASTPVDVSTDTTETISSGRSSSTGVPTTIRARLDRSTEGTGSVQHVACQLKDGDLGTVIDQIVDPGPAIDSDSRREDADAKTDQLQATDPKLLTLSIHSCGNLSHHGLRSLVLNENVQAVAIIGCCYNLATERLRPPSYKNPRLRPAPPPAGESKVHCGDPHGFPMSSRLCNYKTPRGTGIQFDINARMMAVQAPQNWGKADCEDFFTRHFYRAVLQKVFLDYGLIDAPLGWDEEPDSSYAHQSTASVIGGSTQSILIGSLNKACYRDFVKYARGALAKVTAGDGDSARLVASRMSDITDEELADYETRYRSHKKDLSVVWALMAYSAGLVEATFLVDRWSWLEEQEEVGEAWVEPVWDYKQSPRNLVVVGIKR